MMKDWTLVYEHFDPEREKLREALCTLGNGLFATRGAAAESQADAVHYPGTYLTGGYNRLATDIAGRTIENEDLVNLPNWLPLSFRQDDGEWFQLDQVTILDYRQELDLRHGLLLRCFRFADVHGRRTSVASLRLVSMAEPHLAAVQTTWTPENWSGRLWVRSALDGRVVNDGVPRYRNLRKRHLDSLEADALADHGLYLKVTTHQSDLRIAQAARTCFSVDGQYVEVEPRIERSTAYVAQHFALDVSQNQPITAEKIVSLFTSRDRAISECGLAAREAMSRHRSFAEVREAHEAAWKRLWDRFDIELELTHPAEDAPRTPLILRLHLFHLLQTTSPHTIDLDVGVPSRGLHGEAYRGHVFWDEIFIFPLLNLRIPDMTRSLMMYRYRRLNAARRAAADAGFAGAMFPWQSGSDGREESQRIHLNPQSGHWLPDHSRLQRHVNAAIVYNIWQYYEVTADLEFLCYYGAEMMLEIARFWASSSTYNEANHRYEIRGVMGPDEYHEKYPGAAEPGVNNNTYTNVMAVWVLDRAMHVLDMLPRAQAQRLRRKLGITDAEVQSWDHISRRMKLVFHGDHILSQFEGYDDLEEFDWPTYREKHGEVMRLDRILEAEGDTPNRYKASKQADVLMLFFLFSCEELERLIERLGYAFDPELIPKNIQYYQSRVSNGSTLSQVVHAWILTRSDRHRSWDLFCRALQSDVADVQGGTTPEGIHLGAMAGTVDMIQRCYTGLETRDNILWMNPCLPDELARLRLRIHYRQAALELDISHDTLKVRTLHCPIEPLRIGFDGRILSLRQDEELELKMHRERHPAKTLRNIPQPVEEESLG